MAKNLRNLLVFHTMDRELARCAKDYLNGRLIDIGCGTKPYEAMLKPFVSEHVGLDVEQPFNPQTTPDLVGTAYNIPTDADSFGAAFSTAALQHLEEPELALSECHRVPKPGGIAVYSVPFIWHVHSAPRDFIRYTNFGLKHIFEKVGFEILELKALSGFWVTFGQMFVYCLYQFHRGPFGFVKIIPVTGLLIQGLAYVLDRIDRAEEWTWMYLVVARKKVAPPVSSDTTRS